METSDDTLFVLVRHAESVWNADERWQGQADPPLSPRGREQARRLAEALADERFDAIVTSDLRRAFATAEPIARRAGVALAADRVFRELDVGRWTGLRREEIERSDAESLRRFDAEDAHERAGGAESRAQLRARVRSAAAALAAARPGARILLVSHLGVIRALAPGSLPGNAEVLRSTWGALRARYLSS
jgi:probable phosphoglycerate mutase